MDVEQIELLPCPFCGAAGDSLMVEHLEGTILHPAHQVRCDNCGASSGYTSHNFREAWNTRAVLTPPEGYEKALPDAARYNYLRSRLCDTCMFNDAGELIYCDERNGPELDALIDSEINGREEVPDGRG